MANSYLAELAVLEEAGYLDLLNEKADLTAPSGPEARARAYYRETVPAAGRRVLPVHYDY